MQSDASHLFEQAMKLPLDEREALAEQLYLSLHPVAEPHEAQDAVDAQVLRLRRVRRCLAK